MSFFSEDFMNLMLNGDPTLTPEQNERVDELVGFMNWILGGVLVGIFALLGAAHYFSW